MIYDLQKASMWKRISAWLFDTILLLVLITGFMVVITAITGYDGQVDKMQKYRTEYEEKYDVDLEISREDFEKLSEEEQQVHINAQKALIKDQDYAKVSTIIFNLILITVTLSILFAVLIWEFIIPLFLKNGQTVGKKIFGIAVMRTNGVKVSNVQLFIRAILGKFTFEIMLPVFSIILLISGQAGIFSIGMIALVLIVQIAFLIGTRKTTRSAIHDLMSDTVTVDLASQLIFDTEAELVKYKEEQHAKMVERSPY